MFLQDDPRRRYRAAIRALVSEDLGLYVERLRKTRRTDPERATVAARVEKLRALLAEIDRDIAALGPSRRELVDDLKTTLGVTQRQVAIRAFPRIHPDRAVARFKKWLHRGKRPRYPDGSPGDRDIRWAIRSFYE
jgi:hypothetical protein